MTRYRRKPTEITAVQWDGTVRALDAIAALGANFTVHRYPTHLVARLEAGRWGAQGMVDVPLNHWVAKAAENDYYPIDPDVFERTYEPVQP